MMILLFLSHFGARKEFLFRKKKYIYTYIKLFLHLRKREELYLTVVTEKLGLYTRQNLWCFLVLCLFEKRSETRHTESCEEETVDCEVISLQRDKYRDTASSVKVPTWQMPLN